MNDEILIACAWKGTLVLIAAICLCAVLRKASAAARGLVWPVAFSALLLLPILAQLTPHWTAPVTAVFEPRTLPSISTTPSPVRPAWDWAPFLWLLGATLVFSRFLVGTARVWI